MTADRRTVPHFTPAPSGPVEPPEDECRPRAALEAQQGERLAALLRHLRGRNAFYDRKLAAAGIDVAGLTFPDDLAALPSPRRPSSWPTRRSRRRGGRR